MSTESGEPDSGPSAAEFTPRQPDAARDSATPSPGYEYSPPPSTFPADGPPRHALAGFWRRFASMFIDWLLVGVLAGALGALIGLDIGQLVVSRGEGFQFELQAPFTAAELIYFTYFHATSAGQSIGNKILGIRVLDANSGRPLPYVRAFARALMSYVSLIPLLLGYFWMLWDRRKQTWHDKVADCLVVRSSAYPPGEFGLPGRGRT